MMRKLWVKGALLLMTGTVLGLGLGGGCLNETVIRILTAVTFD